MAIKRFWCACVCVEGGGLVWLGWFFNNYYDLHYFFFKYNNFKGKWERPRFGPYRIFEAAMSLGDRLYMGRYIVAAPRRSSRLEKNSVAMYESREKAFYFYLCNLSCGPLFYFQDRVSLIVSSTRRRRAKRPRQRRRRLFKHINFNRFIAFVCSLELSIRI